MPALAADVVQHADDPGRPLVARGREPEPLDELLVGRAAGDRRRARVRHVGEQRAERDQQLDPELAREADHQVGERAPAQVRLDPEQQHDVAVETVRARVVEDRLGPVDPAGQALLERDVRPGRPGSRRSSPGRPRRTARRPRSWRGSRPRARPPARRRSSPERRRRGPAARAPAGGRCEARPPLGQSTCGLPRERPADATEPSRRRPATPRPRRRGRRGRARAATAGASGTAPRPSAICASSTPKTTRPSVNSRGQRCRCEAR